MTKARRTRREVRKLKVNSHSSWNWTLLGVEMEAVGGRLSIWVGLCHHNPSGIFQTKTSSKWPTFSVTWDVESKSSQDLVATLPPIMGLLSHSLELRTLNELQRAHFLPLSQSQLAKYLAKKCNLQGSPRYSIDSSICVQMVLGIVMSTWPPHISCPVPTWRQELRAVCPLLTSDLPPVHSAGLHNPEAPQSAQPGFVSLGKNVELNMWQMQAGSRGVHPFADLQFL